MRMERWCSTAEPIIINSTGIDLISVRIDSKLLISTYYGEMNAFSESCSILAIYFGLCFDLLLTVPFRTSDCFSYYDECFGIYFLKKVWLSSLSSFRSEE